MSIYKQNVEKIINKCSIMWYNILEIFYERSLPTMDFGAIIDTITEFIGGLIG